MSSHQIEQSHYIARPVKIATFPSGSSPFDPVATSIEPKTDEDGRIYFTIAQEESSICLELNELQLLADMAKNMLDSIASLKR
jgi:hypothetical protein